MRIIKCLKESSLLVEGVSKIRKNKAKNILLGILSANLLENLLTGKGVKAKISVRGVRKANEEAIRAGQCF